MASAGNDVRASSRDVANLVSNLKSGAQVWDLGAMKKIVLTVIQLSSPKLVDNCKYGTTAFLSIKISLYQHLLELEK